LKVRSADLYRLIEESWDKLHSEHGESFKSMNQNFFDKLATYIQKDSMNKYKLKGATLYKQYFLKIKDDSSQTDFIGVTPMYLSALSYFLYKRPFEDIDINQPLSEIEEEVPEFPSYHASFPSTPTIPLQMNSLKNIFLKNKLTFSADTSKLLKTFFKNFNFITDTTIWCKDESTNPNGTHKDRMAWEIYLWYENEIKKQMNTPGKKISLKSLSLISSGSAAYSVQKVLKNRGLPNLHVLIDRHINKRLIKFLEEQDCKVFPIDLDKKELSSNEILKLTDNIDGVDLTYSPEFKESRKVYYDWLSYEVLNQNPNWVFTPFGTGDLYRNIIIRNSKEMDKKVFSKRFFGDKKILTQCNFMGAASNRKNSKMKMLYSAFQNKTIKNVNDNIVFPLIEKQNCGNNSKVLILEEKYINSAIEIAEHFNITFEPSGLSGLGLFFQMADKRQIEMNQHDKVIIINTGKSIVSNYC
jgi:enoyl-[acyl-carrier-protein] reductase (NADH)